VKNIYDEILQLSRGKKSGVLVTVVQKTGSGPADSGAKMIVYSDGTVIGTVGGGALERLAIRKAAGLLEHGENALETFNMDDHADGIPTGMICGGTATLYFESFAPQNHIYIFGAGHISQALVYHLNNLDYFVTVVDDRQENMDSIDNADQKFIGDFATVLTDREVASNAWFIIATYEHKYDGLVLNRIFKSGWNPRYVGMVSSRHKQKILLDALVKEVPAADISKCYIPIGLDIGGGSPDEIALSIIAEIQRLRYDKKGGHLRE